MHAYAPPPKRVFADSPSRRISRLDAPLRLSRREIESRRERAHETFPVLAERARQPARRNQRERRPDRADRTERAPLSRDRGSGVRPLPRPRRRRGRNRWRSSTRRSSTKPISDTRSTMGRQVAPHTPPRRSRCGEQSLRWHLRRRTGPVPRLRREHAARVYCSLPNVVLSRLRIRGSGNPQQRPDEGAARDDLLHEAQNLVE